MEDAILILEKKLFQLPYMNDRSWLDGVIHDHFRECGKSGKIYDKKTVIAFLTDCVEDREIVIYNYECTSIDINTYLIHYITKEHKQLYYRTSLWVMQDCLKLLFHQASLITKADLPLTIF